MKHSLLFLFSFLLWACQSSPEQPTDTPPEEKVVAPPTTNEFIMPEVIGSWMPPEGERYGERWFALGDTALDGEGWMVEGADTAIVEQLRIGKRAGTWTYLATVYTQNGGQTIPFALAEQSPGWYKFENPDHDFPRSIMYTFSGTDQLHVELRGIINGIEMKNDFYYHREL